MTSNSKGAPQRDIEKDVQPKETSGLRSAEKRLRSWRKKLDKIERLEGRVASGDTINEQQQQVIDRKPIAEAVVAEIVKVCEQLAELPREKQDVDSLSQGIQTDVVDEDKREKSEDENDALQTLLSLCHCARMFDASLPGGKDFCQAFLHDHQSISMADIDAMQFLCALVDGTGNNFGIPTSLSERVNESLVQVRDFLNRSERELTPGISFARVHDIVAQCLLWVIPCKYVAAAKPSSINFFASDMTDNCYTHFSTSSHERQSFSHRRRHR